MQISGKITTVTRKTKRTLFYSALVIFALLSYIVVLYAQGYKYSFSENKFLRTGAISLKANTGAGVSLDDNFHGNTSFFNSAYSIDRLLPKNYKISLQKDGFFSWQKTTSVEEGLVVDFPNILLLPEEGEEEQELFKEVDLLFKNLEPFPTVKPTPSLIQHPKGKLASPTPTVITEPEEESYLLDQKKGILFYNNKENFQEIANNVLGFQLSENKNKLAWWNSNELWITWLNDQNYQPFHKKGDTELMVRFQIPIQNGAWFRGEDHVILELEQHDSKGRLYSIYKVIEIDKRGGINMVEL